MTKHTFEIIKLELRCVDQNIDLRETMSCVRRFANSDILIKEYFLNNAFSNIQNNSQIHFETSLLV